jgi:glycosyltransferase involved in cell wall biosynthesis
VLHSAQIGGISRSLEGVIRRLAAVGRVHVVVPGRGDVEEQIRQAAEVTALQYAPLMVPRTLHAAARMAAALTRDFRSLGRVIGRTKPDLVIVGTAVLPAAVAAARIQRTRLVVYAAEIIDQAGPGVPARIVGTPLLKAFTARYADAIVCCSNAVARQYEPHAVGAIETVYPPISLAYADGDGAAFRGRTGIAPDDYCVTCAGNISHGRGQDVLLRAIPEIRRHVPRARCLIAGQPHPRANDLAFERNLADLSRQLGVDDRVMFLGKVKGMADLYAASDVVVNPARVDEGFGRVAFEALMAGTPVVAASVGGLTELLRHDHNSLLFPREDVAALAKAVVRLARDAALGRRLVADARRQTLSEVDEVASNERFMAILRRLMSDKTV